jgi:hypothetical protein
MDEQEYRSAVAFLERAKEEDLPLSMPCVTVAKDGTVSFTSGRHLFAALRDAEAESVPLSVAGHQLGEVTG